MMPADTINRLLTSLTVRAHAFAVCEIQADHRLVFDRANTVTVHYVLAGRGTIRVPGIAQTSYQPCSVLIIPARLHHSLGNVNASIEVPIATATNGLIANGLVRFTAGDGRRDTLVVCATVTAIHGGALGVFDRLKAPLVADASTDESFEPLFRLMRREVDRPCLGTQALVESLMKQALVLILRHHLIDLSIDSPLFATMHDGRLAAAVAAVIEQPASFWSVDELASIAGMSRSAFAHRFARAFDHTPMEFVQVVRLHLAAELLRTTELAISVIAASAGFSSRTYFSRTFRSAHGLTPCAYRSHARSGEGAVSRCDVPMAVRRPRPGQNKKQA